MATVVLPNTLADGDTSDATKVMQNFSAITTQVNGNIDADNVQDASLTGVDFALALPMTVVDSAANSFSAYRMGAAGVPRVAEWYPLVCEIEDSDPTSTYDAVTGVFTPNVEGYYYIEWGISFGVGATATSSLTYAALAKNGNRYHTVFNASPGNTTISLHGSSVVEMNGTTDYLRPQYYVNDNTRGVGVATRQSYFHGHLAAVKV